MELSDFGERLAKLRIEKGISAREMSLSLGKSENYINKIENGKAYPAMPAFFDICEYLGQSQMEFFDEGNNHPERMDKIVSRLMGLDGEDLSHFEAIAEGFVPYKER